MQVEYRAQSSRDYQNHEPREHFTTVNVLTDMNNHTAPSAPALASACRPIHPEDILAGDHVTVLKQTHQVATYAWCGIDTHQFPPNEPIEISLRGYFEALEVKDICFPFLLCTNNEGDVRVIDSRANQIGKLAPSFVQHLKTATKAHQHKLDKKEKSKKQKKRKAKR